MRIQALIPTIGVTDLDDAIKYYEGMGFSKDWKWPENEATHASVSQDGFSLMMVHQNPDDIQKADLYFKVNGVIHFHKQIQGNLEGISDLQQTQYGMLDFSCIDPWGHCITFGEPDGEWEG